MLNTLLIFFYPQITGILASDYITYYCIRHISRGFYFREFRESGAIREFINTQKYLPPIRTHECDLCTQYVALLDRELNHSRKCLKILIREKLDSRNIWRIQYSLVLQGVLI